MARSAILNVMVTAVLKAGRSLARDFGEVENLQVSVKGPGDFVAQAARKAGRSLVKDFREVENLQVSMKGAGDFVSKADQISERTIYDELLAARPDWGFVLEEGGVIEGDPTKPRWIIDPLDGTSNFLHGIPHFAISIAAQEPKLDGSGWGDVIAAAVLHEHRRGDAAGAVPGRRLAFEQAGMTTDLA